MNITSSDDWYAAKTAGNPTGLLWRQAQVGAKPGRRFGYPDHLRPLSMSCWARTSELTAMEGGSGTFMVRRRVADLTLVNDSDRSGATRDGRIGIWHSNVACGG